MGLGTIPFLENETSPPMEIFDQMGTRKATMMFDEERVINKFIESDVESPVTEEKSSSEV